MLKRSFVAFSLLLASFGAVAGAPVDLNRADAETIASQVKGIGEIKARAIVDYRKQHGPFESIDDLVKVRGIGAKTLDKIRPYVEVGKDVY